MDGSGRRHDFLRGIGETFGIVAGFVAAGLGAASLAAPTVPARPPGAETALPYTPGTMTETEETAVREPRLWLVDGFNALCVALLRGRERSAWWSREGREEVLARVRAFDDPAAEVWVVFDGDRPSEERPATAPGPRVAFAPSADEWLLRRVREADAGEVAVVTADRRLADRVRARGARVVSPRDFLARCGEREPARGES
jgi:hypothetical protein